jgi:hypothetical protein
VRTVSGSSPFASLVGSFGQVPQALRLNLASFQFRDRQLRIYLRVHLNGFLGEFEKFRAPLATHRIDYTAGLP